MRRDTRQDPWVDRLSEYVDEELGAVERRRLEQHLEACAECRETLDALREVARRAPALAVDADPGRDLWPAIARRLAPRPAPWWRRVPSLPVSARWLPRPALVSLVSLVFVAAGVAGLLWMRTADREAGPPQVASRPATVPPAPARPAAGAADEAYDDTVASLRQVVRTRLTADPYVIDVLDRNLDSLDMAIADYRDALVDRPNDARVRERLEEARQRKLEILRQAAALAAGAN